MTRIYIVDTSYLLELFDVPGFSTTAHVKAVREKFAQAIEARNQIIVPIGCVFELANYIADVGNIAVRRQLAQKLAGSINSSLNSAQPWQITPPDKLEATLPQLFSEYADKYLPLGMGLTDTYTLAEAQRLKTKYNSVQHYRVHIWTKDNSLKAHEPDVEPDPFVN